MYEVKYWIQVSFKFLSTLKINEKKITTKATQFTYLQVNWWAVVLGGLGLLLFMTLFIKICAVHTPSTNPNKTPALNIYDTLRRPKNLIERKHGRAAQQA